MALDGFVGPVPGVSAMSAAPDWEAFFAAMFPSGIEAGVGDEFAPALDAGARAVVVGSGRARLRAYVANATTSTSTPIDAADSQPRIDRLALRLDRSATTVADWIKPKLVKGTPGSAPVAPAYTNSLASNGVWDLPIARWTSAANGSVSGLVDERYRAPAPTLALGGTQWPPSGPGLAVSPTQVLASRDGATWDTTLYDDTGDVTLTSAQTNWAVRDPGCHARMLTHNVHVEINMERLNTTLQAPADVDGSNLVRLPTNMRPAREHYFAARLTAGRSGRLDVQPDGYVVLRHIDADITAGRYIRADISFLVG